MVLTWLHLMLQKTAQLRLKSVHSALKPPLIQI